jgi:polysaccharide export outer membrane protein
MRAIWSLLAALLAATLVAQPTDYTLDTGDVIAVVVLRHEQFSGEYTVPPDGNVVFPGVGNLQVRGQTLQGLANMLRERLSQRLRNPEVFVSLRQARPQLVFVEGQLNRPGAYPIQPGWRVAEAVVSAGGLRTLPERAIGTLIRGEEKYPINLADIFHRGDNRTNYLLQPGDLISIQAKETLRVAVIGEVQTTGFLNVPNDARLADAIAQAGGLTGAAALRRAYIDRKGEIIPLDLYRTFVLGDLQGIHNPPLQEGDVIVVPKNMRRYAIVGQVNQPGYYGIREGQPFLLSDAIALAGGVNNRAITSRITILRVEDGAVRKVVVPYQRFLKKGDLEANPVIQDGDVIYIAEATKLDLGTIFGAASLLNLFNQLGLSR